LNKVGVFSLVYSGTLAQKAEQVARHGLDTVIINASEILDLAGSLDNTAHARKEAGVADDSLQAIKGTIRLDQINDQLSAAVTEPFRQRGMQLACLGGYVNPMHPDPVQRRQQRELFYTLIRHARAFGTRYVATETGSVNPQSQWEDHPGNHTPEAWKEMVEFVSEACAVAEAHDTVVLIEGYVENVLSSLEGAVRLRREVSSPALGFVLDPNNYAHAADLADMEGYLHRFFEAVGPWSHVAHGKDVVYVDGRIRTPKAGSGYLDYPLFGRLLRQYRPDIPVIVEHLLPQDVPEVVDFVRRHIEP